MSASRLDCVPPGIQSSSPLVSFFSLAIPEARAIAQIAEMTMTAHGQRPTAYPSFAKARSMVPLMALLIAARQPCCCRDLAGGWSELSLTDASVPVSFAPGLGASGTRGELHCNTACAQAV